MDVPLWDMVADYQIYGVVPRDGGGPLNGSVGSRDGGGPPDNGTTLRDSGGPPEDGVASRDDGGSPEDGSVGVLAASNDTIGCIGLCGGFDGSPVIFFVMSGSVEKQERVCLRIYL
ncbi:unnamed protein product [Lactuca saligna]|uniref:Uncharacterized protein n=1 Tax=Lactuca saligna TaxID=75948 RepID=A0AA35ZH24_LACSI|nr:unnamed protein product [Lactuca saligna]